MAAPQSSVRYAHAGQTLHLQVDGWGTMKHSLPLRRFVEQQLTGDAPKVALDLRLCTYIDSTFLGTLLYLKRAVTRRPGGNFSLVAPSAECARLLAQMGVADIFHVTHENDSAPPGWNLLSAEPVSPQCFQRNVIEAHEELASLPGAAGEPFRAVVRCLAKDAEKKG